MITTDLRGRVDRINLKPRHSLTPLFEAISNSVHAIQAAGRPDGLIVVELTRDTTQGRLPR